MRAASRNPGRKSDIRRAVEFSVAAGIMAALDLRCLPRRSGRGIENADSNLV